jgi:hypothetical protein
MTEKRKIVYRVLVGTYSDEDEKAHWETWSTWDTQKDAYNAMHEYREEWGRRDVTPIRIVKITDPDRFGNGDETFIDETGADIIEWARMVRAGEHEWEEH